MTEPAANSRGWPEAWFARCGERPWRAFCWLWLFLFGLSLVQAFAVIHREKFPTRWPDPAGIDYQSYLVGGKDATDRGFALPPLKGVPQYEASKKDRYVAVVFVQPTEASDGRLIAFAAEQQGYCGWRGSPAIWGVHRYWDVSDPEQIMDARKFMRWSFQPHYQGLNFGVPVSSGSKGLHISLRLPASLFQIALPQTVSVGIVGATWLIYRIRRWRRRKSGRCLMCGHQFDPQRPLVVCAECGQSPVVADPAATKPGSAWIVRHPGSLAMIVFGVLVVPFIALQCNLGPNHVEHSLSESIAVRQASGVVHRGKAPESGRVFGWPVVLGSVYINQWFDFGGDQAIASPPNQPLGWTSSESASIYWMGVSEAPNRTVSISFNWALAVAEVAALQIVSMWMTFVIVAILRRRDRARIITPKS